MCGVRLSIENSIRGTLSNSRFFRAMVLQIIILTLHFCLFSGIINDGFSLKTRLAGERILRLSYPVRCRGFTSCAVLRCSVCVPYIGFGSRA